MRSPPQRSVSPGGRRRRARGDGMKAAIDNVAAPDGGRIGLMRCPGTRVRGLLGDPWRAALDTDLGAVRAWGARALVTLLEAFECRLLGVDDLGERARAHGLEWWHLPVVDGAAPGTSFEHAWHEAGPALHRHLDAGGRVVVHCRAGVGRSGAVAARLLVERGVSAERALAAVRRARPGAVEARDQAEWVHAAAAR